MKRLNETVANLFSRDAMLRRPGVKESGRGFLVTPRTGDTVVGFRPEAVAAWPDETPRCDAVFLCRNDGGEEFRVILVELKGGHVNRAITQLATTHDFLCRSKNQPSAHAPDAKNRFREIGFRHYPTVLGLVICRSGIQLKQQQRKALLKKGLHVRIKTGRTVRMSAMELTGYPR